jgi:hypothetical protein
MAGVELAGEHSQSWCSRARCRHAAEHHFGMRPRVLGWRMRWMRRELLRTFCGLTAPLST